MVFEIQTWNKKLCDRIPCDWTMWQDPVWLVHFTGSHMIGPCDNFKYEWSIWPAPMWLVHVTGSHVIGPCGRIPCDWSNLQAPIWLVHVTISSVNGPFDWLPCDWFMWQAPVFRPCVSVFFIDTLITLQNNILVVIIGPFNQHVKFYHYIVIKLLGNLTNYKFSFIDVFFFNHFF